MGDANPIRTLADYSKPSHECYRNTIELPVGNNVVPLRIDTTRLVQKGCSFHVLRFEDPNQHLKGFLKLMDSLDLNGENKERTRLLQIFYDHVNPVTRQTIDQSVGGKLHDRNAEESWALLEDLALYDNESWNDPRDFAKPVKAISLPQDVPKKRLCSLRTQLGQQQDDMISKINLLCKAVFEKLDDTPIRDTTGDPAAQMNFTNPSSLKHVHFVNSILILNKEDEAKEEGDVKTSTIEYEDHEMTVESGEEFEEETEDEIEEEEEDSLKHFDTFPTMKELRLSLASHSYIYPLGIAEDMLVDVAGYMYLVDFVILDIKEDEKRPFILGTPFLKMAKAVIKFDKGTITLRSGKSKISFHRIPESLCVRLYLIRRSLEVLRKFIRRFLEDDLTSYLMLLLHY
ncbi:MAK10-like protein [Tanacetum coccineum]